MSVSPPFPNAVDLFAGQCVDCDQPLAGRVEHSRWRVAIAGPKSQAAIGPSPALKKVGPSRFARLGPDGRHALGARDVHHAIGNDRNGLSTRGVRPCLDQRADVVPVDLVERRVAGSVRAMVVVAPLVGGIDLPLCREGGSAHCHCGSAHSHCCRGHPGGPLNTHVQTPCRSDQGRMLRESRYKHTFLAHWAPRPVRPQRPGSPG